MMMGLGFVPHTPFGLAAGFAWKLAMFCGHSEYDAFRKARGHAGEEP